MSLPPDTDPSPGHTGRARILIGTSGWMYRHWANGVFYPPRLRQILWLPYYIERFPTVEINASFYRLPSEAAVAHWAAAAPADFRFAVKCWRWITHIRRLKETGAADVQLFFQRIEPMWRNLGPVLVQLPPSMKIDLPRLDAFLANLPKRIGRARLQIALEVRHESSLTEATRSLLDKRGASLVLSDWKVATEQTNDAPFVYIRRHGSPQYSGNYGEEQLQADADLIRGFSRQDRDVYVYYNNDVGGHAVRNARRLREILSVEPATGE